MRGALFVVLPLLLAVLAVSCGPKPAGRSSAPAATGQARRSAAAATPRPILPLIPPQLPTQPAATGPGLAGRATEPAATPALAATGAATRSDPAAPTAFPPGVGTPTPGSAPGPAHSVGLRERVGIAVPDGRLDAYAWGNAMPGWYLSWGVTAQPVQAGGVQFAQMVRLHAGGFTPAAAVISSTARLRPGALWLIGNEPDAPQQDNVTPQQYAGLYHTLYGLIKGADASAQIAIGGVGQPSTLRMAYLDRILATYRSLYGMEMPVDVWNVHAFILREERGSWGLGIPPGMDVNQGTLYEVVDHANMDIFRRQIVAFRQWMAERGLRDKPLIVSEYGILMPADYGFPPEVVGKFMTDSFDFFLNARDPQLGYPADDNRLVQAFCWYSAGDKEFPTSNLFDPTTRAITPLGTVYKAYMAGLQN